VASCCRLRAEVLFESHVCDGRGCSALLQGCTPSGRTSVGAEGCFIEVFASLPEDLIKWAVSIMVVFAKKLPADWTNVTS